MTGDRTRVPLHWEHRVSATGPAGRCLRSSVLNLLPSVYLPHHSDRCLCSGSPLGFSPAGSRADSSAFIPSALVGLENLETFEEVLSLELCCCRRLLRVPGTARRSNQSILKEISFGCSLEAMMLKLKLQDFGHLMRRVDSLEHEKS